jgi:malonyl-CoA O-methyltransferase
MDTLIHEPNVTAPNKPCIGRRFDKASNHYNQQAVVQQQMAKFLMIKTLPHITSLNRYLEIGCGSGLLTQQIFENARPHCYTGIDLAASSAKCVETICIKNGIKQFKVVTGDAENIIYPTHCDVLWSGATVQWFGNRARFIDKAADALIPKGLLALSTFGPRNFHQIKAITNKGLCYDGLLEWQQMLSPRFNIIDQQEWQQTLWFNSPLDVLRHIKATGVGGTNASAWTKTELRHFEDGYEPMAQRIRVTPSPITPFYCWHKNALTDAYSPSTPKIPLKSANTTV